MAINLDMLLLERANGRGNYFIVYSVNYHWSIQLYSLCIGRLEGGNQPHCCMKLQLETFRVAFSRLTVNYVSYH